MLKYTLDIEDSSLWLRSTPADFALKQPFCCTEAGIFYAREHFNTIRDSKDSCLIFLTIAGCGQITQNGVTVKLPAGKALFMNCRSPQSYCTDPETGFWTHYWIHVDGSGVQALQELLLPENRIRSFDADESLIPLFDKVLKNMENQSAYTVMSVSLSIHRILTELITHNTVAISENQRTIRKTADWLAMHYREPMDLDLLLAMANMSKSYFMRLFRQYIGTTPYNYLLSLRMTKAKELLEVTDMTIHEIAMETGFSDDAAFSTRFSSMIGISPLKYRRAAITRHQG
ncbi:MAG: AraC family transcriptional regulator [Solobacterium sp.]|nr:AraC family transcriptional regulator [Solobacterium sp.]